MNTASYALYYDFLQEAVTPYFGLHTLIPFALAAICIIWFSIRIETPKNIRLFILVFSALIVITVALARVSEHNQLEQMRELLKSGSINVVEGPIENMRLMPYHGHALESITVQNRTFEYSEFHLAPGFRSTVARSGSILRNGLNVRISYFQNYILRIEVKK
ncbi:hypothetical protein Turpa_3416 [Turneriella parva DSM 21527]|uniref:Uncharacterized protein n=1 Tax=Turneriella parva (strain ATCC BAA-1111 / DSM 21527 / NCTC 11395 / H) TaxID=869212 RepID=I4B9U6_TURPD|nr:hypothetical protein Turpa_3416 [Turneriella parva DSM 21527]